MGTENEVETETTEQESSSEETKPVKSSAQSHDGESNEESDSSDGDDTESTDAEGDEQADKQTQEKPKKNGFKKRIDKLNRRATEAEERAEYWRQKAMSGQPAQENQSQATAKEQSSDEPNPENYESHLDYLKDWARWDRKQEDKAKEAKASEAQLKSEYEQRLADHNKRVAEFKKDKADYDDKVQSFLEDYGDDMGDYPFSPALHEAFQEQSGPALLYELLDDPEELDRINSLGYSAAMRELGKIEARRESKKESSAQNIHKTSKAPSPVSPIGKGSVPVTKSLSDPNLPFAEYEKLRIQQLKKK